MERNTPRVALPSAGAESATPDTDLKIAKEALKCAKARMRRATVEHDRACAEFLRVDAETDPTQDEQERFDRTMNDYVPVITELVEAENRLANARAEYNRVAALNQKAEIADANSGYAETVLKEMNRAIEKLRSEVAAPSTNCMSKSAIDGVKDNSLMAYMLTGLQVIH